MTPDSITIALASIMDSLMLLREDLDALARGQERIERDHAEIRTRLEGIDAGQAAVTDLLPLLEAILGRVTDDGITNRAELKRVAEIAAHAHAAAAGRATPLPVAVTDDPLLERFIITQAPDYVTPTRALAEWRQQAPKASSRELAQILARQYEPSPTDTPDTRVLRYQLAAITRAELVGRGATPPAAPHTTRARDRSPEARAARSKELAVLWRAGVSLALYAEPELAGAIDRFTAADRQAAILRGDQIPAELVALHRNLAARIEAGERSFEASSVLGAALRLSSDIER
jgi:hypothetical protein